MLLKTTCIYILFGGVLAFMYDSYELRANGALNFLCAARSASGREMRKDVLFAHYAKLAEERMPLFTRADEKCGFYSDAVHLVGDALWWAEHSVPEAKRRFARFYRMLDEVVDANLVPPRRT